LKILPRRKNKREPQFRWREEWRPEEIEWLSSKDKDWMTDKSFEELEDEEEWGLEEDEYEDEYEDEDDY
jgi:hypothetical protein